MRGSERSKQRGWRRVQGFLSRIFQRGRVKEENGEDIIISDDNGGGAKSSKKRNQRTQSRKSAKSNVLQSKSKSKSNSPKPKLSKAFPSFDGLFMPRKTAASNALQLLQRRTAQSFPTAIVGFREYIFSSNTGALGQYSAATEFAFSTIQQRIMTNPGRVRMHYGHPDVFNKLHCMTRGGISKGTRILHVSEDYFSGVAHTLRGARIQYKEYISCGKGRDMGFDSILGYQTKISGGGADLVTSREIFRIAPRLDFFRLFSFYFGGVGHYINCVFSSWAIYFSTWSLLVAALTDSMQMSVKNAAAEGGFEVEQTYGISQVIQLGMMSLIPYIGQLVLETGLLRTGLTVFGQIVSGSLVFYVFQQQTIAMSFSKVMAYGGAKYIATGRGFSLQTTDFVKLYCMYARTHLYFAFELAFFIGPIYLTARCQSCNMGALTWNTWFVIFVMVLSPLWFNPFVFSLEKVDRDFQAWRRWMNGDRHPSTQNNWVTWNRQELEKARNDSGHLSDYGLAKFNHVMIRGLPYAVLVLGAVSRIDLRLRRDIPMLRNAYVIFGVLSAFLWTVGIGTVWIKLRLQDLARSRQWRIYQWITSVILLWVFILYIAEIHQLFEGNGFGNLLNVCYANMVMLVAFHRFAVFLDPSNDLLRQFVDYGFYAIDMIVGFVMISLLALLSFIGVVGILQSKLLFNDSFAQTVNTTRISKALRIESRSRIHVGGGGGVMEKVGESSDDGREKIVQNADNSNKSSKL
eukprot:CAMPEP_0175046592 /NCGR_PEP_ID=MMETSP0052_2-20121109/5116_1 /TAXON_ID=51329 ORGANISM="Polytomella parva, Strain SAG 63-3" /NCGR_SAMPLE_ID=MMETSP0052_2 /ASSEMBLY_ACC=CAM_ASM_000194 /LENGTH=743 /DNA_ID=CAMNT_0016310355 /DNA_START=1211 /DNA_END=3442 /DNA_ORIENTATION=-